MIKKRHKSEMKAALLEFVQAIEATGGVVMDEQGYVTLVVDEDWIDLGEAYLSACKALRREPNVQ